jgi:hypothetical protein
MKERFKVNFKIYRHPIKNDFAVIWSEDLNLIVYKLKFIMLYNICPHKLY